ncbi:hypothetical protein [Desulfosporosinus orientis]|uniref:hypothetical protein n=1 Tax=Desulfosporosinus orientis TaxID=1563 RepID=UPI0002FCA8CC|nr:hypothetical protein [Desulfosporosinus orientis]
MGENKKDDLGNILPVRRITVNSQNLRGYAGNNQTSGIHGTLKKIGPKGRTVLARICASRFEGFFDLKFI